jgi:hypothetical protein
MVPGAGGPSPRSFREVPEPWSQHPVGRSFWGDFLVTLVRVGSLPHQPEESVIKSGDPGDTEHQGDNKRRLRADAIENVSEIEHDTGPCFRSLSQYCRGAPN